MICAERGWVLGAKGFVVLLLMGVGSLGFAKRWARPGEAACSWVQGRGQHSLNQMSCVGFGYAGCTYCRGDNMLCLLVRVEDS